MRYIFLVLLILAVAMLLGQIERERLALTPFVYAGPFDRQAQRDGSS